MSIDRVVERVKPVLQELEIKEGIPTKLAANKDAGIIRIYGEGSDSVKRASSGLEEMLELAYATSEHHPYWAILYHAAEISKITLETWGTDLTTDHISEMLWRCDEIKIALGNLNRK